MQIALYAYKEQMRKLYENLYNCGEVIMNMYNQNAKADAGKLQLTLVPTQLIRDVAEVRMYGNAKYGSPDNWKEVEIERYRDALFRHLLAYLDDPDGVDPESGIANYKHLACNDAFICHMEAVRRGEIRCEEETTLYSSDE